MAQSQDIETAARAFFDDLQRTGVDPAETIAKYLRAAVQAHADPLHDVLADVAAEYAGAAEGSDEEKVLDKIGAAIEAYDAALGNKKPPALGSAEG